MSSRVVFTVCGGGGWFSGSVRLGAWPAVRRAIERGAPAYFFAELVGGLA